MMVTRWMLEPVQSIPAEGRHSVLSPQPGVFRFGLLEDRDVWICVLPERQEILVGSLCLGLIAQQSESSAQLQMRQSAHRIGANNAAVSENLLKFRRGFNAPMGGQIRLAAHIGWVKASEVRCERVREGRRALGDIRTAPVYLQESVFPSHPRVSAPRKNRRRQPMQKLRHTPHRDPFQS